MEQLNEHAQGVVHDMWRNGVICDCYLTNKHQIILRMNTRTLIGYTRIDDRGMHLWEPVKVDFRSIREREMHGSPITFVQEVKSIDYHY